MIGGSLARLNLSIFAYTVNRPNQQYVMSGRYRIVVNFTSPKRLRRNRGLSALGVTLSILASAAMTSTTVAYFSSASTSDVTVSAGTWIVPSLTITPQNFSTANVQWRALSDFTDYTLQWSKTTNFASPNSAVVSGNSYTVSNLEGSTNYYFRIKAVGAPINSGWSSTFTMLTSASTHSIVTATDTLAFDAKGELWNYGPAGSTTSVRKSIAPAGTVIPENFYVTDWNGDKILDLVVKTIPGVLELWKGLPQGGFEVSNIGNSGWQRYDIAIGAWKKTDNLPSIVAINKETGELFHYTNPVGSEHGARVLFDTGWQNIQIQMVDFDKDGNPDLVARIQNVGLKNGEFRLYRSNGDGAFITEERKPLGSGWNSVDSVTVLYGVEGSGTLGFISREKSSGNMFYYSIENTLIVERRQIGSGFTGFKLAGN